VFTKLKINEIIYIALLESINILKDIAFKVLKSLYGLKQAVRD
jgi:hypothetical protein